MPSAPAVRSTRCRPSVPPRPPRPISSGCVEKSCPSDSTFREKVLEADRLDEVVVEAGFARAAAVLLLGIPADRHQQRIACFLSRAQLAGHLVSVELGKAQIEQYGMRAKRSSESDGRAAVVRR